MFPARKYREGGVGGGCGIQKLKTIIFKNIECLMGRGTVFEYSNFKIMSYSFTVKEPLSPSVLFGANPDVKLSGFYLLD